MVNFKSLKKPLLSAEVEEAIKQTIAEGLFKPGEKLPSERQLVEQFEVSRVTVRDALRNLERSGLVHRKRGLNAGAYVSEPNARPIIENFQNLLQLGKINYSHLIDARLYFEPLAARTAAMHRTESDIKRLNDVLTIAENKLDHSRKEARLTNVSFHCEIANISKNPLIVFITESITVSYSELLIEKTKTRIESDQIARFINEHRRILAAITDQKSDLAYEETRNHLIETYKTYSKILSDETDENTDIQLDKWNEK
jgi:GntR family transcriptional repressor for pyruvate dehydrogenase complex